ncbi:MAG: glycosyltransferase [Bacteroidetes bacterium]|nr:glycosyltransferase [Bacteroidota bacterium]MBU1796769.1 glycosyltransferase [Bacteroidota bacterium]
MKYSIIIPTLNEEKLLPILLEQFVENNILGKYNCEIIISDGGSTDSTVDVARKYTDKIVVHDKSCRQTIADGRNIGANIAAGDIFIFIDGDILFDDLFSFMNKVETVFNMNKYIAMTCYINIKPTERILTDKIFMNFYNIYFRILNNIGVGMGRGECQIIPKKVFNEVGGYNKLLVAGEDFDLFKRIRKKGKILFDKSLVIYESPRRYRKYGHIVIFFSWLFNAISVIFKNRSISKEWEEVR